MEKTSRKDGGKYEECKTAVPLRFTEHDRMLPKKLLSVCIEYGEVELGKLVKAAGGRWNREKKVWELAHSDVAALGLLDRVVYR
ncbi:MAG: hypothetical protein R2941_04150 [Desulfobacterales bacterium]